jgi:amidophosphoribosyltransferase
MESEGSIFQSNSDTEVVLHLAARSRGNGIVEMLADALSQIRGAASLLFATADRLIAYRDPHGFRPLALGRVGDATLVASETCAFDLLDATFVRDIRPGELLVVGPEGEKSVQLANEPRMHQCIFEHIYFARPDSKVFGENVDRARRRCGKQLAREHPVDADIVISVPDSSNTAAMGYARVSGIRYEIGLIRNHYIGRTFIDPEPGMRSFGVRVKFNPVVGVLRARRVVVVDDSIVRGTTMRKLVRLIRSAGASEVHLRIASPPVAWPCFYGIDTPAREELLAARMPVAAMRESLGVDSLGYLSLEGLRACVEEPRDYCTSCFDVAYPVDPFGEHEQEARRRAALTPETA